jgi:hypothetical protein
MKRAWLFSAALSVVLAWLLCWRYPHALDTFDVRAALAAIVVAVAWRMYGRKPPKPPVPPPPFGTPDKPNRAWARMMYHNGLLSLEELQAFYDKNPE